VAFEREPERREVPVTPDDETLRCARCEHRITELAYRSERDGAHEHTFVNPHGVVHHIGCFVAAPGCAHIGPTETAFTWFPGFSWQVAVCGRCRAHLGWIFCCAGDQFHGLLLAALRRG
jgi:hypothetical protein